ncbi:VPLPA-CTERM sorting domain-containing protein [Maridesulfovibrio sp. FT414]|uniref:VPLPA-CTERM sorting domain-containing protein n=1 Tax=Maridesulfovibrio sp. FT414 TaxID=2979469 RepID=UPI003D8076AF
MKKTLLSAIIILILVPTCALASAYTSSSQDSSGTTQGSSSTGQENSNSYSNSWNTQSGGPTYQGGEHSSDTPDGGEHISPTPLPAAAALLCGGLGVIAFIRRKFS